jgi:hypothetical protein
VLSTCDSIQQQHAVISQEKGTFYVERCGDRAKILVNGEVVTDQKTEIGHNDRYGTTNVRNV